MATLLELARLSRSLNDMLEETGGELTPEIEASLALTKENLPGKVDAYYFQLQDFERRKETFIKIYEEAERCIKLYDRLIDKLENNMEYALKEMKLKQVIGEYSKFNLINSRQKVEVNLPELSESYLKTKTEKYVDKLSLYDDLKSGIEIKGARLVENTYLKASPNNIRTIK